MTTKPTNDDESDDVIVVRVVSENGDSRESQWWECSDALVKGGLGEWVQGKKSLGFN